MRALGLALIILTSGVAAAASEEEVDEVAPLPRKNALLFNVGDLLSGALSLEYERGIVPWLGINAGLGVAFFPTVWNTDAAKFALRGELGFRFHFIRHAPGGLWIGPYAMLNTAFDPDSYQRLTWGLGAALGYNFVLGRYFTLQVGGGGGFTDYGDHVAWTPRLRLALGASF